MQGEVAHPVHGPGVRPANQAVTGSGKSHPIKSKNVAKPRVVCGAFLFLGFDVNRPRLSWLWLPFLYLDTLHAVRNAGSPDGKSASGMATQFEKSFLCRELIHSTRKCEPD
jgi:hypothetical protein